MTPNQLFLIDNYRYKISPGKLINENAEKNICIAKGLLTDDLQLTNRAIEILDEMETFLVKRKKKVTAEVLGEGFLDNIKEYREYFPAIRLPNGEMARQNVQELKDKFIWFFKTYPEYNWDIVLEAAKYYTFIKEREQYQYMSTSSYFIQKTDTRSKKASSKLADYCQIIIENPDILITN